MLPRPPQWLRSIGRKARPRPRRKPREIKSLEAEPFIGCEALEPRVFLSVTVNAAGWTKVGASADTQVIYVSRSRGDDSSKAKTSLVPGSALWGNNQVDNLCPDLVFGKNKCRKRSHVGCAKMKTNFPPFRVTKGR